jgi:hypothetical protein
VTKVGFRGVLFDSGDTLIRPVGGRWNPRFDFEEIVLRHLPELAVDAFPQAFAAGQQVLDAAPTTPSLAAYYRAILHALGVGRPAPELLRELEQPGAGRCARPGCPRGAGVLQGRPLPAAVAQAARLLAVVVAQDLEQAGDGGFRVARKVAVDRVISTVDRDARHGHKSSARGVDGYKGTPGSTPTASWSPRPPPPQATSATRPRRRSCRPS